MEVTRTRGSSMLYVASFGLRGTKTTNKFEELALELPDETMKEKILALRREVFATLTKAEQAEFVRREVAAADDEADGIFRPPQED
jgi:hypothetical protein